MAAKPLGLSYPAAKAPVYRAVGLGILQQHEGIGSTNRKKRFVAREIQEIHGAWLCIPIQEAKFMPYLAQ